MDKNKFLNRNALDELNSFFQSHFIDYESTLFGKHLSIELNLPDEHELSLGSCLDRNTDDFYNLIIQEYNFETDAEKFNVILSLCFGLADVVKMENDERPNYERTKKQIVEHNRLLPIIEQAPNYIHFSYPEYFSTDVLEIHFVCKKEKPIKISDKNEVLNLLANLKAGFVYGLKVAPEWKMITAFRQEAAKMLHKYFENYSTLVYNPANKTSNEICRVIHAIFLYSKVISKQESEDSRPEDYIRTLILRSSLS